MDAGLAMRFSAMRFVTTTVLREESAGPSRVVWIYQPATSKPATPLLTTGIKANDFNFMSDGHGLTMNGPPTEPGELVPEDGKPQPIGSAPREMSKGVAGSLITRPISHSYREVSATSASGTLTSGRTTESIPGVVSIKSSSIPHTTTTEITGSSTTAERGSSRVPSAFETDSSKPPTTSFESDTNSSINLYAILSESTTSTGSIVESFAGFITSPSTSSVNPVSVDTDSSPPSPKASQHVTSTLKSDAAYGRPEDAISSSSSQTRPALSTAMPRTTGATSTASTYSPGASSSSTIKAGNGDRGLILGCVLGGIIGLVVCALAVFCAFNAWGWYRAKKREQQSPGYMKFSSKIQQLEPSHPSAVHSRYRPTAESPRYGKFPSPLGADDGALLHIMPPMSRASHATSNAASRVQSQALYTEYDPSQELPPQFYRHRPRPEVMPPRKAPTPPRGMMPLLPQHQHPPITTEVVNRLREQQNNRDTLQTLGPGTATCFGAECSPTATLAHGPIISGGTGYANADPSHLGGQAVTHPSDHQDFERMMQDAASRATIYSRATDANSRTGLSMRSSNTEHSTHEQRHSIPPRSVDQENIVQPLKIAEAGSRKRIESGTSSIYSPYAQGRTPDGGVGPLGQVGIPRRTSASSFADEIHSVLRSQQNQQTSILEAINEEVPARHPDHEYIGQALTHAPARPLRPQPSVISSPDGATYDGTDRQPSVYDDGKGAYVDLDLAQAAASSYSPGNSALQSPDVAARLLHGPRGTAQPMRQVLQMVQAKSGSSPDGNTKWGPHRENGDYSADAGRGGTSETERTEDDEENEIADLDYDTYQSFVLAYSDEAASDVTSS